MKEKSLKKWLRENIFNKETIIFFLIAELIFWSPVIICSILALTINSWYWGLATTIMIFWAGPFTPAIPLQIALTFGIKKVYTIFNKGVRNGRNKD